VGFPAEGTEADVGAVVVPGTVLPLDTSPSLLGPGTTKNRDRALDLADLSEKLRSTVRLKDVSVRYALERIFRLGKPQELPGPSSLSPLNITATLLGANEKLASYRVQFRQGPVVLADTNVAVERGKRVVVGSLDGEEAPYLFLVLEPSRGSAETAVDVGEGFTPPLSIDRVAPQYTEAAREKKIVGLVVLQAVIDEAGDIVNLAVMKGLPYGLSEAAVDAIRQWTFEPALDSAGKPIRVFYNLTINFTLD